MQQEIFKRPGRALCAGYCALEGAAYLHHTYALYRAKGAPPPKRAPPDPEYGRRFLKLARCDAREGASPHKCAQFLRHAFFGVPPEALRRVDLEAWLRRHVGEPYASDEAMAALETALGPFAPLDASGRTASLSSVGVARGSLEAPAFVFGEGEMNAIYKPLLMRVILEVQRLQAQLRLMRAGFVRHQDPRLPELHYWEQRYVPSGPDGGKAEEPPLVVLHGYGRGLASPLFDKLLPELGRKSVVIVDCSWLLVTRVPTSGDVTSIPTVREIADAVTAFLAEYRQAGACGAVPEIDILAHSFGTAVASALARQLPVAGTGDGSSPLTVRRMVLMDPMCFMPGITKQAQLVRRMPKDLAAELLAEASPGAPAPSYREVLSTVMFQHPAMHVSTSDESAQADERRRWLIFQTYFFFFFVFRDLVYSWVNVRSLQGHEYLDLGNVRKMNRNGQLLTILAETDMLIPSPLLRDDLAAEAPPGAQGGVLWLPTVGHGACQHRADVAERVSAFLAVA